MLHRSPRLFDLPRSRWWLDGLRQAVDWLRPLTCSGGWRQLRRLRRRYKRGRRYVHSPDPDYERKLTSVHAALHLARWQPTRYVVIYEDELTYSMRPTVAQGYAPAGLMRRGRTKGGARTRPGASPAASTR